MNTKRYAALAAILLLVAGVLTGCKNQAGEGTKTENVTTKAVKSELNTLQESKGAEKEQVELIVFAAASLTETLTEIAEMYKEVKPDVTIVYTFDSSGTLKTLIEEGADCDIFISAAQKPMNQLDASAGPSVNTESLDFVLEGTRFNLVENKVVLAVPDGNPAGIESYEDLGTDKLELICIGNEDVPVGAYSLEILRHLGILEYLENNSKITYGSNVKEVTTQIKEASVDCGIIYATDAFSAGLTIADEADASQCSQVIYPAAVLNVSGSQEEAKAFLDYLTADACAEIFEAAGFSVIP